VGAGVRHGALLFFGPASALAAFKLPVKILQHFRQIAV
jgi:hypothetical protein